MAKLYVRAIAPSYALADVHHNDYSLWYVGHTIFDELTDKTLSQHAETFFDEHPEKAYLPEVFGDFVEWLGKNHGYIVFYAGPERVGIVDVPDPGEMEDE
jgi:hypothetical protein